MKRVESPMILMTASVKEMREIAAAQSKQDIEKRLSPAHLRLLDPRHQQVISPVTMRTYAPTLVGCNALMKLIGSTKVIRVVLDIPVEFFGLLFTSEDWEKLTTGQEWPQNDEKPFESDHHWSGTGLNLR